MYQSIDCLPGIITIHDDICIYSHTPKEHDQHLSCWCRQPMIMALPSTALSVWSGSLKLPSMAQCSVPKTCGCIHLHQPSKTLQPLITRLNFSPSQDWSFIPSLSYTVCQQKYVLVSTASWVGLEPINGCSLPALQSLDLPDPTQCKPYILW